MAHGRPARSRMNLVGRRLRSSVRNALEIARFGGLGADYSAPFDIVDQGPNHRLRRYVGAPTGAPAMLLIPPLMLTAEIYDVGPDVSCVAALVARGITPFVVDFGAPEHEAGGMDRSLDDHVRAVLSALSRTRELTGRDVHLAGYSQGGMFAYQAAAYVRGEGIASLVTFGSPVDIHKNLPVVRSDVTGALARSVAPIADAVLTRVEGLPGKLTSTAFKVVSSRKELSQRVEFLRSLHDRERIMKREAKRRFLGGAGFVAWPGPALRDFFDNFIVHNRLLSGGFVIDGRTVSLSDLTCPILAFVGKTDEFARPPTVRAIEVAAPNAPIRFVTVPAGHFGMVVGKAAASITWPAVARWIEGIERGERGSEIPELAPSESSGDDDDLDSDDLEIEMDLLLDVFKRTAGNAWRRLGDVFASATDTADTVRWQEPRLRRLARIEPDSRVSASRELAKRAKDTPLATFFLWGGRAFSYADADARVSNVARGLHARGARPGEHIGVLMASRPSLLSTITALGRLGAISVVAPEGSPITAIAKAFERLGIRKVVVDPERAERALMLGIEVLVLGGGGRGNVPEGAVNLEAVDVSGVVFPKELVLDPGRARDVSSILLRPSDDARLRAVPVTNHRWALSAIGAAAACTIKPSDTVLCAVPLHHPTGMLVSAGAALVGGARLALGDIDSTTGRRLDPNQLLVEIRRVGATIVFYAGEMLRPLLEAPVSPADRHLPVRFFAGSGMRPALAARLRERFGVDTMEFYAGTSHRSILADADGRKPGSLGDVLPGSAEVELVRADFLAKKSARDDQGHLVRAATGEPGLLAVRVDDDEIATLGDTRNVVRDGFGRGSWLVTGDVLERDTDGQYWFVDALSGFVTTKDGPVSLRRVEDAFYTIPEIGLAAACEGEPRTGDIHVAIVATAGAPRLDGARLEAAVASLPEHARPTSIALVSEIPLTEGFRPSKRTLRELPATIRWQRTRHGYERT